MAEIPALFSQRPIVLRHQRGALYHPFTDALALTLVDIPVMFVTVTIFGILLYFLSGLQISGVSVFRFNLLFHLLIDVRPNSCKYLSYMH